MSEEIKCPWAGMKIEGPLTRISDASADCVIKKLVTDWGFGDRQIASDRACQVISLAHAKALLDAIESFTRYHFDCSFTDLVKDFSSDGAGEAEENLDDALACGLLLHASELATAVAAMTVTFANASLHDAGFCSSRVSSASPRFSSN
jgi:hypothetical protein